MNFSEIDPFAWAVSFSIFTLGVSLIFAFIRLVRGPSLCDRVVAFDLITTLGVSVIAIYAVVLKKYAELDIAMIAGLIAFLGTVALAYYIEKTRGNA